MSRSDKITSSHLGRQACVYVRQSTPTQVERNRESTARQYKLVDRAVELGWRRDRVRVIDEDLGVSGEGLARRDGFEVMASEVALGRIGLVLAVEVSRVARNNAEWYRLLDFCGVTDTLIGDEDGVYHPGLYNDRLLLGLKGTMSEAELHVIRARLVGGIRNKAERGGLRRALPVGLVWGEGDGEIRFDPDEAVTSAVRTAFEKFAEMGSVRQVWIWFRSRKLLFPIAADSMTLWRSSAYLSSSRLLHSFALLRASLSSAVFIDSRKRLPRTEWSAHHIFEPLCRYSLI